MSNENVIYLAGGCFWGMEKLMKSLSGVTDVVSGYANGHTKDPNYRAVCKGDTGYREAVKVTYDAATISLDAILFAYFAVVDPTAENRQGGDIGTQYQTGIYYTDGASLEIIDRVVAVERQQAAPFHVEIAPLTVFYDAEAYHQDYLDKNPGGYCHIPLKEIALLAGVSIDPSDYNRPAKALLRDLVSR